MCPQDDSAAGDHAVTIVEVSPRDGLQSDPTVLPVEARLELISRAVGAGIHRIEAVSFVNPDRVPQMAGAEELVAALPADGGVSYIGLVLNRRGFERALQTGLDEINVVVVCTDTFGRRNQGASTRELIDVWAEIAPEARAAGLTTSVTLTAAFGCPFEGAVPVDRLVEVAAAVAEHGPDEIALADSIGVAVPTDVRERVAAVAEVAGGAELRCHFHNTRNTGLANAAAAVEAGVRTVDSSLGGIGGCPFAPRATGNIPTEDVVYLLHGMGYDTGTDLDELIGVVGWLEEVLGHDTPGLLARAGNFGA